MKEHLIQDIKSFLAFEAETSIIYPFAIEYEKIVESYLDDIAEYVVKNYENPWECSDDELYESIETICGSNPILENKVECERLFKEWKDSYKYIK